MRKVTVTLVIGIALVLAVSAATLTRAPPQVVRAGRDEEVLARTGGDLAVCQPQEVLPADVSAIRVSTWAFIGYDVHLRVYRGLQLLTEGSRGADWTSNSVTVPVTPLERSTPEATVCFAIAPNSEPAVLLGVLTPVQRAAVVLTGSVPTPLAASDEVLKGRLDIEYLTAGRGTWWSRVDSVATRLGLGRVFSGTWIAFLIAALMAAAAVLAVRLTLRELP